MGENFLQKGSPHGTEVVRAFLNAIQCPHAVLWGGRPTVPSDNKTPLAKWRNWQTPGT